MKKYLIFCWLLCWPAVAEEVSVVFENDITAAMIGANVRFTDTTAAFRILPKGEAWQYIYRSIYIGAAQANDPWAVDTAFGADTVYVLTQTSLLGTDLWTQFDSTKVILNGNSDTLINLAPRMDLDSSAATANAVWMRAVIFHGFSVDTLAADSAIVGNDYPFKVSIWFLGRN